MWTLWIISSVIDSAEPKYTRYDTYETKMSCHIERAVLEANFTLNEGAVCKYEKRLEK